jgi:hypothetical protein
MAALSKDGHWLVVNPGGPNIGSAQRVTGTSLQLWDVADPAQPALKATLAASDVCPAGSSPCELGRPAFAESNTLYVGWVIYPGDAETGSLAVLDVSAATFTLVGRTNPGAPGIIQVVETGTPGKLYGLGVPLSSIDVSDPSAPQAVKLGATNIYAGAGSAFASRTSSRLRICQLNFPFSSMPSLEFLTVDTALAAGPLRLSVVGPPNEVIACAITSDETRAFVANARPLQVGWLTTYDLTLH